jgi:nucleotide-binding universal stress UspA family protein
MMKRILVPLDGSALAERALAVAAKLARASDGELILVQALPATIEYGSSFIPDMIPLTIVPDEREAQGYLTRLTELPMLSGLAVTTSVLADVPALAILSAATRYRADMIVMTSHGRNGITRWVFGSVAEHVARQAHLPVLILRQSQMPFWTEGAELVESPVTPGATRRSFSELRVLVPLDGSPLAEAVLEPAAESAVSLVQGVEQATMAPTGSIAAVLHLVLVVRPADSLAENVPESLVVTGAQKYLRQVADRMRSAHTDVHVTWEVGSAADVAGFLVTVVQEDLESARKQSTPVGARTQPEGAPITGVAGQNGLEPGGRPAGPPYTLLAMATHGRTGIVHWVWGSITERVIHKTRLPVLLVRPAKPSSQADSGGKKEIS